MTQKRSALHHLRLTPRRPNRILHRRRRRKLIRKPIRTPLPHITRHRIQPKSIRRKASHRTSSRPSILSRIHPWKLPLPDIAQMPSLRRQLIAPRIQLLLQPTPRGILPLRLRRQRLPRPGRISRRIIPGDMHHRILPPASIPQTPALQAPSTKHPEPCTTTEPQPTVSSTSSSSRSGGRCIQNTNDHPNCSASVRYPVAFTKRIKVRVRNRISINLERRHAHPPHRPFAISCKPILIIRTHQKRPATQRHHRPPIVTRPNLIHRLRFRQTFRPRRAASAFLHLHPYPRNLR